MPGKLVFGGAGIFADEDCELLFGIFLLFIDILFFETFIFVSFSVYSIQQD